MATPASPAATMKLVGGDPCLDFVNTVGGRVPLAGSARTRVRADKLAAYPDLVAWSLHAGLVDESAGRGFCDPPPLAPARRWRRMAGRSPCARRSTARCGR